MKNISRIMQAVNAIRDTRKNSAHLSGLVLLVAICVCSCNTTPIGHSNNAQTTAQPLRLKTPSLASAHSSPPYTPKTTYDKLIGKYPHISLANTELPKHIDSLTDVHYQCWDEHCLSLDIYKPRVKSNTQLPAILLVHGGGWRTGDRTLLTALAIALAERGWISTTVSYRLAKEAKYPAAIYDVKAAVRWLRKHAAHYNIDPNFIAIAGSSAGGQIASLVGTTNGLALFDPKATFSTTSSAVQAIVNIDGLSDFTMPEALKYENDPRKTPSSAGEWFGGRYEEVPKLWQQASPIYYIHTRTPPILFIRSGERRFSLGHQEVAEKLQHLHIATDDVHFPDSPHSFWLFNPWLTPTADAMDKFLKPLTLSPSTTQPAQAKPLIEAKARPHQ